MKTECYNCGYETECKKIEFEGKTAYICEVCMKSRADKVIWYPTIHIDDGKIIQTIAWGINYLRDSIKGV